MVGTGGWVAGGVVGGEVCVAISSVVVSVARQLIEL